RAQASRGAQHLGWCWSCRRWCQRTRRLYGTTRRQRDASTAITPLTRILFHRVIDEIIHRAFKLARHLLKPLPQAVAALKRTYSLAGVRHRGRDTTSSPGLLATL